MKHISLELLSGLVASRRKALRLSQSALSRRSGINRSILSRLETADYSPSVDQLLSLSEVLDFNISDVFVDEEAKPAAVAEDAADTVASIMSRELFNDEQIEVIAEAMLEGLPEKYMLCFLKKDYSPEIMRKLKDYCTKLYREEVSGSDGSR